MGPAKVIFQDRKVVFVHHGSVFVRVSPNRLVKSGTEFNHASSVTGLETSGADDGSQHVDELTTRIEEVLGDSTGQDANKENATTNRDQPDSKLLLHALVGIKLIFPRKINLPKGEQIRFKLPNKQDWNHGRIVSRGGKASGKYKNWFNIQLKNTEEEICLDLDNVDEDTNISQAKQAELERLRQFEAYTEVEDTGQQVISTKWVLTSKASGIKARLVARGFEEELLSQTDSPAIGKSALKLFLAVVASKKWIVKTTDIKCAILQGLNLERDVFICPPEEAQVPEGAIWKLQKCLYGLNDGARQFYLSVREHLKLGCTQSSLDPALFATNTSLI